MLSIPTTLCRHPRCSKRQFTILLLVVKEQLNWMTWGKQVLEKFISSWENYPLFLWFCLYREEIMDFKVQDNKKKVKYLFLSLDLVLGTTQRTISTDLHNNRTFLLVVVWLWFFFKAVFSMIHTFPTAHTEVSDQALDSYLTVPDSC